MNDGKIAAVILAAGRGTRMKSTLPKVLHEVAGLPMALYPVRLSKAVGCDPTAMVIGHEAEAVEAALAGEGLLFALQEEQLGTGHALLCAQPLLAGFSGTLLLLCGDVPLLREEETTWWFSNAIFSFGSFRVGNRRYVGDYYWQPYIATGTESLLGGGRGRMVRAPLYTETLLAPVPPGNLPPLPSRGRVIGDCGDAGYVRTGTHLVIRFPDCVLTVNGRSTTYGSIDSATRS